MNTTLSSFAHSELYAWIVLAPHNARYWWSEVLFRLVWRSAYVAILPHSSLENIHPVFGGFVAWPELSGVRFCFVPDGAIVALPDSFLFSLLPFSIMSDFLSAWAVDLSHFLQRFIAYLSPLIDLCSHCISLLAFVARCTVVRLPVSCYCSSALHICLNLPFTRLLTNSTYPRGVRRFFETHLRSIVPLGSMVVYISRWPRDELSFYKRISDAARPRYGPPFLALTSQRSAAPRFQILPIPYWCRSGLDHYSLVFCLSVPNCYPFGKPLLLCME